MSSDMVEAQRRRAGFIMYGAVTLWHMAITHQVNIQRHAECDAEESACFFDLRVNIKHT